MIVFPAAEIGDRQAGGRVALHVDAEGLRELAVHPVPILLDLQVSVLVVDAGDDLRGFARLPSRRRGLNRDNPAFAARHLGNLKPVHEGSPKSRGG
jgi:hypothetical protein